MSTAIIAKSRGNSSAQRSSRRSSGVRSGSLLTAASKQSTPQIKRAWSGSVVGDAPMLQMRGPTHQEIELRMAVHMKRRTRTRHRTRQEIELGKAPHINRRKGKRYGTHQEIEIEWAEHVEQTRRKTTRDAELQ